MASPRKAKRGIPPKSDFNSWYPAIVEIADLVDKRYPIKGMDGEGRPIYNHVDATIMSPYQGTKFYDMINLGVIPDVEINADEDPGNFYYKGVNGGSGWPYKKSRLPRSQYVAAQNYRNSLRPRYR